MKTRHSSSRKRTSSGGYAPVSVISTKKTLVWSASLVWLLLVCALVWGLLFMSDAVTLGGVPATIVGRFLQDTPALAAFFTGNKAALHQRLQELGIEEQIKDYYRPRIPDEIRLDQYIHQILYNWTSYVGDNYIVSSQGVLVLKKTGETRLKREINEKENDFFLPRY